jgi:hypothetical protein
MISQADLFDKATSYERLVRAEGDEIRKKVWLLLRDMWIALAKRKRHDQRRKAGNGSRGGRRTNPSDTPARECPFKTSRGN